MNRRSVLMAPFAGLAAWLTGRKRTEPDGLPGVVCRYDVGRVIESYPEDDLWTVRRSVLLDGKRNDHFYEAKWYRETLPNGPPVSKSGMRRAPKNGDRVVIVWVADTANSSLERWQCYILDQTPTHHETYSSFEKLDAARNA